MPLPHFWVLRPVWWEYEPSCLVPRYLSDQGITSVVAPFPTKSKALWTQLEDWMVIVYPFLDGETSWTGMTDEQWKEVGTIFQRTHQVILPPFGFESTLVLARGCHPSA